MATTTVIGMTPSGRKVHMAWMPAGTILCERGPLATTVIAPLLGEGMEGTMAVLDEHNVAVSRLCAHCFGNRLRKVLADRRRKAREGNAA